MFEQIKTAIYDGSFADVNKKPHIRFNIKLSSIVVSDLRLIVRVQAVVSRFWTRRKHEAHLHFSPQSRPNKY